MKKNVTLVCDLQFGSTGKGLIAGYLAERDQPDLIVTAWSPNAGHTYINSKGQTFIHTMLANGIVSPKLRHILIGPGSVVNMENLMNEVAAARKLGYLDDVQILIHPHAAIVSQEHRDEEEKTMVGIGSTRKGAGAALIEKIHRNPNRSVVAKDVLSTHGIDMLVPWVEIGGCIVRVAGFKQYNDLIDRAHHIQVEGAQGFSLGINNGYYPYTTSRECTPAQIMTDCNVPMAKLDKVVGCMRTYPIRVANRYDEGGTQIGFSGPGYNDQREITWDSIGVTPEKTTVTKLERRVFDFSFEQAAQAIRMCSPDEIFLNFCNYMGDHNDVQRLIIDINRISTDSDTAVKQFTPSQFVPSLVRYLGEGPTVDSVYDILHIEERVKWTSNRRTLEEQPISD